jgi:hypothetical protein
MSNLIFKLTSSLKNVDSRELISVNKNYRKSILECIKKNFTTIENVFPFYDSEDEYGNNLYFKDTPQGIFDFLNLNWYDYKTVRDLIHLDSYNVKTLKKIINIQKRLIYPDYNGDFKKTFYCVETWKIN